MGQQALSPDELARRKKEPFYGQARKSRAKDAGPALAVAGRPKPPKHLCPDALIEFKRISKILGARNTETPGDASTLAVYAEVYSRWVGAKRTLTGQGLMIDVTVLDSNGAPHTSSKLNPLIRVVENCERQLLSLTKAMGLTPDTRERVKPAKEKEAPKQLTLEEEYFGQLDKPRPRLVPMRPEEEEPDEN